MTASGSHPLKLLGVPGSPYSRKLRAVLRFRRLPHLWAFGADVEFAARTLPYTGAVDESDAETAARGKLISEHQIGRLFVVGSNVFGQRPAASDFGLFGQLTQLVQFDPTPMAIARAETPRILAWLEHVEDLSGLGVGEGAWIPRSPFPDTLRALLCEVGRVYAPLLLANARSLAAGAARVECEIDGKPWVQQPFPYQGKCLAALRAGYAGLAAGDRRAVDERLAGTGCEVLFA